MTCPNTRIFDAVRESACSHVAESSYLQELHAGGGTRTPDTRIMMTARKASLTRNRHRLGVVRCSQFGSKSGVGRTVRRTVRALNSGVLVGVERGKIGQTLEEHRGGVVPRRIHCRSERGDVRRAGARAARHEQDAIFVSHLQLPRISVPKVREAMSTAASS